MTSRTTARTRATAVDGSDALLLGVRLLLGADLLRLCWRRLRTYEASVRMLEAYGFSSPNTWMAVALLSGAVGAVLVFVGWRVRWGAALVGLGFMPVGTVFSATYVPAAWPGFWEPLLTMAAIGEDMMLGGALALVFLLGAGRYTVVLGGRRLVEAVKALRQSHTQTETSSRRTPEAA